MTTQTAGTPAGERKSAGVLAFQVGKRTVRISLFEREHFLTRRWYYEPGQHVTFLGPTGSGKTTLTYQLLQHSARPSLPAVVLAMKPRDKTVTKWNETLGFRVVRHWPPMPSLWQENKPPGWTLWPKHSFDPDRDNPALHKVFRAAILDCYKRGNRILVADELFGLADELKLHKELVTVWTRGRSMGCGLWGGTQKPTHIPTWAYGQAEHLFLHNDPDKRAIDRFSEIGGVDPDLLKAVVSQLPRHHWLYVRRDGPHMCVVSK